MWSNQEDPLMDTTTAIRPLRRRRPLATSRSLDSAELAIADGKQTIGEISAMVEMEKGGRNPFDDPFPDFDIDDVQPVPRTLGAEAQEMFGMSLWPLMLCIVCMGSVAGIVLGFALDGTPLQQGILSLVDSIY